MTTPSDKVRGPQDLVARMNEATSEDWDKVPFPAKQQLGFHDRLADARSGNGINEYTGKGPEELAGSLELSEVTDSTQTLSSFVDYHLESTPPPAEPAGAPGSDGYNRLNRGVPPAKGFENEADATVTQTDGARAVQFAPDQGLSPDQQAKVDGVGPFVPSPVQIVAGQSDENTPVEERPIYGTANGVQHGDATTFKRDSAGNAPQGDDQRTGAVAPGGASDVRPPTVGTDESIPTPGTVSGATSGATPGGSGNSGSDSQSEVPSGSIDKVLAWVGDDKTRAQTALDEEQQREEPRRSLIEKLNSKIDG